MIEWDTQFDFLESLELNRGDKGEIEINQFGANSITRLFTEGETKTNFAGQLLNSAVNGEDVAKYMIMMLIQKNY